MKSLGPGELAVLREINGKNSVEAIALACRVALFHVANFLYQGLKLGLFELGPPAEEEPEIPGFSQGSWRVLIKLGQQEFDQGQYAQAYDRVRQLRGKYGDQREIRELTDELAQKIEDAVEDLGLSDTSVPELAVAPQELPKLSCSPQEGFLLSRVNGAYTLGEVLKLLPGAELENRLLVHGLVQRGVLRLRDDDAAAGSPDLQAG